MTLVRLRSIQSSTVCIPTARDTTCCEGKPTPAVVRGIQILTSVRLGSIQSSTVCIPTVRDTARCEGKQTPAVVRGIQILTLVRPGSNQMDAACTPTAEDTTCCEGGDRLQTFVVVSRKFVCMSKEYIRHIKKTLVLTWFN